MFQSVSVGRAAKPDAVVLPIFAPESGRPSLDRHGASLDADGAIARALARPECTGKLGTVVEAHPASGEPAARVLLLGLGSPKELNADTLRSAAASLGRRLATTKDETVRLDLDGALKKVRLNAERAGQSVGEALGLLAFNFNGFKGSATANSKQLAPLKVDASDAVAKGVKRGLGLSASCNLGRALGATPPNVATPMWMAERAKEMAKEFPSLSVTVIKGAELAKHKLNGLINVGKASENEACMIRIAYTPPRAAKGAKPVVLVGKTITYDTGGLSIKPTSGMKGMKGDKDGGCVVFAAMHAVASVVKPNFPVVALLPAAENCISDEAYRPDDVLTFRNGVTVEVTNTDAEGRLVLADALCWACDKEDPAYIVDLATLTGGVITALGSTYAGMWCEDSALGKRIEKASAASGERVWRLPLHQEYRDMLRSDIADIVNSNPNRKAHPIQGAAFLSYFVGEDVPWCHIDIAGMHVVDSESGAYAKGTPTAFGVRLLAELLG